VTTDRRAPVLVGAGAITQRAGSVDEAVDAFELLTIAVERAGADSGVPAALGRIDLVLVPKGIWSYRDPGRAVAARFGSKDAHSILADVGILQQTLLSRAATAIAGGHADVVLVGGTEAKQRATLARRAGIELRDADPSPGEPDELLLPDGEILSAAEIARDLAVPVHQYALIESTLAHAAGRTPGEQHDRVATLWARFAAVAAANEEAWDRTGYDAAAIGTPGPENRMVATPYTKRLCSDWNVDQAGALLLMAAETAAALGIPRDRWVFAHAGAESNFMVTLPRRAEPHRWPAFEAVADALRLTGPGALRPDVVELYSCFPSAVQVQADALGLALDAPLTVTGGMTFAGGPLNNAVVQGLVALSQRLREHPAGLGLITSVSGLLTKPGASLWSSAEPASPFRAVDVTAEARERTATVPVLPDATGAAVVAGSTILYDADGAPDRAVAIVDVDGGRTVAVCRDIDVATEMVTTDWVGCPVDVTAPGVFTAPG
jgi:acetyl-CoA C-acetyltransferase